ncbi:unnamed protein product [Didymodactylos carnosus]|uniref:Uncharacterized protein n=1 Tax=Didymodactylos carnosus TaxID=1234261 RepID=A0A815GVU2_9BILA|nr:unnamed protein product [Didymodactylos carnosus]CAF4211033.1 unnamed protein product [Didymodactylos carnosus]CAF4316898.1 unnamed protein product [Didymodactylos carnosus]
MTVTHPFKPSEARSRRANENDEIPLDECTAATNRLQKNKKAVAQTKKPVTLVSNDVTSALDSEQKPKEYKDRPYLRADHIRPYLYSLSKPTDIGPTARHINRFVTISAPIYDAWIRDNYEYQVIEKLLEIGMEDKHWAHEIVKKTITRDDTVNDQYCIDKISQRQRAISNHGNAVTKLQCELKAFVPYYHDASDINNNNGTVTAHDLAAQNARKPKLHIRAADTITQEYLMIHIKKFAEICANRVNTAYAELKEFVSLKTFEEKATPVQRAHVKILQEKLEILHGKQKTAKFLKEEIQCK